MARKRLARGPVFHDKEPTSLHFQDGETRFRGEYNGIQANATWNGDKRPDGCDLLAHGTIKEFVGYASRIVVTLASGIDGGCNKPRQLLRRARERFGFRLYPLLDNGEETAVYTLAELSQQAIDYLRSKWGIWIANLDETPIRLPGNGAVDHIARKPKRKGSSYHQDYRRSEAGTIRRKLPPNEISMI